MIVLDRIAQQVGEKFLHLLYIGPDAERLAVRMEEHLAGRCLWFQAVHDFLQQHADAHIRHHHLGVLCLQLGNHQDIVNQASHIDRLFLNPPGKIHFHGFILNQTAFQQFRISLDGGDWRLKLMGSIAEKLLAYLLFLFNLA